MQQRNDTGTPRLFPTLRPPLEVGAGETIDYPARLGVLTLVVPRAGGGAVEDAASGGQDEPVVDELVVDEPAVSAAEAAEVSAQARKSAKGTAKR